MTLIQDLFIKIEHIIKDVGKTNKSSTNNHKGLATLDDAMQLIVNIINALDNMTIILKGDETILVSVKNQKILRTCFQIITSLGFSQCLIPGLGISLNKRCALSDVLPTMTLNDEEKYKLLVDCTDFFTRSYSVPVLKNIIVTFHLSDYIAALIQLSFAPLKKPGTYEHYTMTKSRYDELLSDRKKYTALYENLMLNCFQPFLMKELLVLQSVIEPPSPNFVKRIIAKEMSSRLLAPGGLLSLIRCFIESYGVDTGFDWKKIEMVCKIISVKHGNISELDYLTNICAQINSILLLHNTLYITTAAACVFSLSKTYSQSETVIKLRDKIFQSFDYNCLKSMSILPGTILMTAQETENKINLLQVTLCSAKLDWPFHLWGPNMFVLFALGIKCTKSDELKGKIKSILIKCLQSSAKSDLYFTIQSLLFGSKIPDNISIEEFEAGLIIKSSQDVSRYSKDGALSLFLSVLKGCSTEVVRHIFEVCLQMIMNITNVRTGKSNKDLLSFEQEDSILLDDNDEQYAIILQLLSEVSTYPEIMSNLKQDPTSVLLFIEHLILNNSGTDKECLTIALVLLNTILSNAGSVSNCQKRFRHLIPSLKNIEREDSSYNSILCKEALTMILEDNCNSQSTAYSVAVANVFDKLLPVRAHGIMELTKLIDKKDPETIAKKHYIFCLLQDQLQDSDSYIYLSTIRCVVALGMHCTEDVLHVLCKEFLSSTTENEHLETSDGRIRTVELRMKVGDALVMLTKRLGEMAVVHKTELLNTMLCASSDHDPFIRTSALSNLAEIALVINYKLGTIIYEVLLCIWSILDTDKAIECRRAAVMAISSLLKGLGKETLIELKENLLPLYRTLKNLYNDPTEDSILKLHAQIALEELNDIVRGYLQSELSMEKSIYVMDKPDVIYK